MLQKHQKVGNGLDEERVNMMVHAWMTVMDYHWRLPMTQQNIIDKLEQYRKETGNDKEGGEQGCSR
jgi:hypothetical protein